MCHPREPDELLEIPRYELRPIVRDDPGTLVRVPLESPLEDDLHFTFLHAFPDVPVHDEPAHAVKNAAEVIKSGADVDVGYVNMPVLVRLERLLEARALKRRLAAKALEQTGC